MGLASVLLAGTDEHDLTTVAGYRAAGGYRAVEKARALAPDDWRRRSDHFQEPALSRNLALRDALRPIARRHGTSVSAIAIAWTTALPGVTAAIDRDGRVIARLAHAQRHVLPRVHAA